VERVSQLIEKLKDENPEVRYRAMDKLAEGGSYEAVVALINVATDRSNSMDQLKAIEVLAEIDSEFVRNFFMELFRMFQSYYVQRTMAVMQPVYRRAKSELEELIGIETD